MAHNACILNRMQTNIIDFKMTRQIKDFDSNVEKAKELHCNCLMHLLKMLKYVLTLPSLKLPQTLPVSERLKPKES